MKRLFKLLLLAAVALPSWVGVAAQTEASGQEVTTSPERTDVTKVNTVGWQEQFQHKSPDVAPAAYSVRSTQPAQPKAKVQPTASSADKKPLTNGHARKAPATPQNDGKRNAPAIAPRGAAKAPPTTATIEEWQIQTDWYEKVAGTSSSETGWVLGSFGRTTVNVAITSSTVYIQGLSKYFPDAWVEGTITNVVGTSATLFEGQTKVTFSSGQLYGTDDEGVSHYFVGEWKESQDTEVWFWYDATNGTLSQHIQSDDDGNPIYNYICEGTTATDINGFGYHEGTVLTKIVNRPMKTLSEAEVRALVDTPDGDMFHYSYPINVSNPTKTGTLLDHVVVTNEDSAAHAIALLRAVYTNQYLPGPYYRGFTSSNVEEGSVDYSAVGSVTASGMNWTHTSSGSTKYYTGTLKDVGYDNTGGWNIEPKNDILTGMPSNYKEFRINGEQYSYYQRCQYAYFNPIDYKPKEEGYTLLLVEVQDNFKTSDIWDKDANNGEGAYRVFSSDPYENLVQYVLKTIKSVRLITEARRTGTNTGQGTLFKIDANKLNRFFIISKGQMRKYNNSYSATYTNFDFCEAPYYGLYKIKNQALYDFKYNDDSCEPVFYHMFEQFSPSAANSGTAKADIYKTLVTGLDATGTDKTGFPVYHDCSTVPFAECDVIDSTTGEGSGHEFKMLGASDPITNAPDVRDLLFFVPDHRLTYHSNTTFPDGKTYSRDYALFDNDNTIIQSYIYYNQDYPPRMDMYVIHLNPIEGEQVELNGTLQHVYQLELNWKSNMSSFLPASEQRFTLWRMVTDANGSTEYQRVYRVNEMGLYVDANGEVLSDQNDESLRVQVEMEGVYSLNELDYFDYVPMDATGKEVTYYVQGRDTGEFLSLQSSNEESYLIPGYDKNVRLTLKIDTDNYSKFDLPNEKNNYWNEIAVANNKGTSVTANFLKEGTVIDFSRRDLNIENTDSVIVARATVIAKTNSSITVRMDYIDQVNFTGSKYSDNLSSFTFTYPTGQPEGVVDFGDWKFYDNFQADVSQNEHPGRYVYRAFFHSAEKFLLDDNVTQSNLVYSNVRGFKVFKTNPSVNSTVSLQQVLDDANGSLELTDNSKYKIDVERTSKQQLWRYEVCRWTDNPSNSQVPTSFSNIYGTAQNQDEEGYSLSFCQGEYQYEDDTPAGSQAVFEDRELKANGGAYCYVPQAVVFTKRTDNNTYGAPRESTAIGKLQVSAATPNDDHPLMSDYKWQGENGKWYSYYNIFLNFSTLEVPEGYELYKVRAWRKVSDDILGEEISTRVGRATNDWYMYEDINFRDDLGLYDANGNHVDAYMSKTELAKNTYFLGSRPATVGKPLNPEGYSEPGGGTLFGVADTQNPVAGEIVEDLVKNELRSTFGAQRLKTDDPNDPGTLEELNAEFKVRAYFTKSTNPLITDPISAVNYDPIYVVGLDENGSWDLTKFLGVLRTTDGSNYTGTVAIPNAGDGNGLVTFSKKLASTSADWDDFNKYRFGLNNTVSYWNDGSDNVWVAESNLGGTEYDLRYYGGSSRNFRIKAGTYQLSITGHKPKSNNNSYDAGSLKFTAATANAPRRAGETRMTGDDYDYYIAESDVITFHQDGGEGVITGIMGVKQDVNRQVVGVSYVNTVGQVSSTPWQGVNMVVTRYSDGSTTTRKVVK